MRTSDHSLESDSDTDVTSSSSSSSESDHCRESSKRHGLKRKRSRSRTGDDTTHFGSSSDDGNKYRKSRSSRLKGKKSSRRKEREDKEKKKEKKRRTKGSDEKRGRRHGKKEKKGREKRHKRSLDLDSITEKETTPQLLHKSPFQVANEAQIQQKELVWRSVEMAKARLASGELQKKKHEQMEMQRLYGSVDWREKKKLRAEKSRLERTIAAGKKLASIEERESARMDAFRVALGLPTAEAQRQAEWRAEATRALAEAEALNKDSSLPSISRVPSKSPKVIGPRLPS